MRGHPTPMGVFSIIQKHKFHHSNIYSGAPMPYMQRITWSGVAMHAGVIPGYPASHGCIRMPMNFAVKMWGWTKMGARVVVTPGEMTPSSFSHPLLTAQKPAPTPVASTEPQKEMPLATKSDKAMSDKAMTADATIHVATTEAAPPIKREQAQRADASRALPQSGAPGIMSDATPSAGGRAAIDKTSDTSSVEAKSVAAGGGGKSGENPSSENKPVSAEPTMSAPAGGAAKSATPATEAVKAEEPKVEPAKSSDSKAEAPNSDAVKRTEKFDDAAKTANDASATAPAVKKDQARPSDAEKAAAARLDPAAAPKRTGQIAVFVSRKDSKLYVRQNFAPLFEMPVTIAPGDLPLATHVFTAQADKDDPKAFHWSVVSLPAARQAERHDDDERASRRRKTVGAVEVKPAPSPDSAAEALDRITIPEDAMARFTEALSTGGSIIVSDQGITAGETSEGTDFIVSLR